MRKFSFLLSCCLCVFMPFSALAAPTLQLKGDEAVVTDKGKSTTLPDDEFEIHSANGKDLRFLGIGEDAKKIYGLPTGVYLFDKTGKQVNVIPLEEPDSCYDVQFSPDGKIMAVDEGASVVRTWYFFSYPELKLLGETNYFDIDEGLSLVWNNNDGVLYSNLDLDDTSRTCGYDPCAPTSVMYFSFKELKEHPLLSGSTTCDFMLKSFDLATGEGTATKLCVASGKDWEKLPEDAPAETVTFSINKK